MTAGPNDVSTYTTRNRIDLPGLASYDGTWGTQHVNPDFDAIDASLDGIVPIDASKAANPYVLSVATDISDDESRHRVLVLSNASPIPFVVRVPPGEKWRWVVNGTGAAVTVTDGTLSVAVPPGVWSVIGTGTALVLGKQGSQEETVVPVTAVGYQVTAADAGHVLLSYGSYAFDLSTFAAQAQPGATLRIRTLSVASTVTYLDPYVGASTDSVPAYGFLEYVVVSSGYVTRISGSPEAF